MFTGIIEGMGTIQRAATGGKGLRIAVSADFPLTGTKIGDSIAVNGACLTAVTLSGSRFEADVSPETVDRTTFKAVKPGDRVNVERAMRLSDRLDGHLVSGHVDGVGTVAEIRRDDNAWIVTIAAPEKLVAEMIEKGSVAVDGISLTINRLDPESFTLAIIPHTAEITTIGKKRTGDRVNLETDMIGKYVRRFLSAGKTAPAANKGGIDMEFLVKTGFL